MSDGNERVSGDRTLELVRRARAGEQDAWKELYEQHRAIARVVVSGRIPPALRSRFSTEDLYHSAFLSFLSAADAPEIETEQSLRAYLARTLKHKLIDRLRANLRDKRDASLEQRIDTSVLAQHPADEPSVPELIESTERQARMLEAIDRLPPDDQELVWWRLIENRSWQEIADASGLAVTTVRMRVARAVEDVARFLNR